MEYVNQHGRHIAVACARCRREVYVAVGDLQNGHPREVVCDNCQIFYAQNPDVARREFEADMRRSDEQARQRRARWAAEDAAKQRRTA